MTATAGFVRGPVAVTVPATSANVGPGYDSLGLTLGLRDRLSAEVYDGPLEVEVTGEGARDVPRDSSHLVVRAMAAAFERMGVRPPGLRLRCDNVIPHARGLGSSSAAIVGGIALARTLVDGEGLSADQALALATRLEGHPDNVAPAQLGGFTVAITPREDAVRVRNAEVVAASLPMHPEVRGLVLIPTRAVATTVARALLPERVPHADAAADAGRSALLVAAVTVRPDLLLAATEDLLHQEYRRPAMPESLELVWRLRSQGHAAVISGAGPAVLVLGTAATLKEVAEEAPAGWATRPVTVGGPGVDSGAGVLG